MAFLGKAFDPMAIEPSTGDFDLLPAGKYPAIITDSEMVPTKAGTGHYLKMTFEIIDGPKKSRKVWANLNLDNPNKKAEEIAWSELSSIGRALGAGTFDDTAELHNKPLVISVKIEPGKNGYGDSNKISAYLSMNEPVSMAPAPEAPAPVSAPATEQAAWWDKK